MDLNSIISKIYVITSCNKKLKRVINRFNKIGNDKIKANITKYKAIDPNKLSEDQLENVTTASCNQLCSIDTISQWLSHYKLWKNIVKNKETNVLILEDTVAPANSFYDMLLEYWKEIPDDWDMVYFGCSGSCDSSIIKDTTYRVYQSRINNVTKKDGKDMVFVMEPGFPLGIYGYMLSLKGAKKLLANDDLKKVDFSLDYSLAKKVVDTDNFKAYSFKPPLIMNVDNPIKIKEEEDIKHSINKPFTCKMSLSDKQNLGDLEETPVYHIRKLGVDITYTTILFMLVSLLIGYFGDAKLQKVYLVIIIFLQMVEMAYTKTSMNKLRDLLFELMLIVSMLFLGKWVKQKKLK